MYEVTNEYKEQLITPGRIKNTIIEIEDGELTVGQVDVMTVEEFNNLLLENLLDTEKLAANKVVYRFEGQIYKTIMRELELEVKGNISLVDKILHLRNGLKVNGKFEYIDFGNFNVKDIQEIRNKESVKVIAYDNMLKFMIPFDLSKLNIKLPCTAKVFAKALSNYCGVELYTENFFNNDILIDEDYFTIQKMTCRDVLEKLAQATLCTIFIKEDKLYFSNINSTKEILDINVLKTLKLENKFGPINSFVLGRGDVEDNVYDSDEQSISTNGLCEIRFDENEILDNKREEVITNMFNHIKGLEFYPFEAKEIGIGYFEPCDLIISKDRQGNEYKCLILNLELTITSGMEEIISAEAPDTTTTEYKYATKEEKANLKTWRLAKKNEGIIEDVIQQTTENTEKLSKHEQTIDSITDKVSSVEEKADNAQSTADGINKNLTENYYTRTQTDSQITQKADSITSEVNKSISTAKQEAIDSANSSTDNKLKNYTKTVDMNSKIEQTAENITSEVSKTYSTKDETNKAKQDAINSANTSTDNKLKNYSTTTQMNSAITQKANEITSTVSETYSTKEETSTAKQDAIDSANSATDTKLKNYSTTTQMNSAITQKANEITTSVSSTYETKKNVDTKINSAKTEIKQTTDSIKTEVSKKAGSDEICSIISQSAEEIHFEGNRVTIKADNLTVNKDGTITCKNAQITGNITATSGKIGNFTIKSGWLQVDKDNIRTVISDKGFGIWKVITSVAGYDVLTDIFTAEFDGSNTTLNVGGTSGGIGTCISDEYKVNGEGTAMYGKGTEVHKYRCYWTGSQLQFWVDETNVGTLSDKRLKTDIKDIDNNFIKAIEEIEIKQFKVANRNGLVSFGILAQDLIEIFKKYDISPFDYEIVYETEYRTDDDTIYYAINYEQFLILKAKAQELEIKQLQEKDKQKDEIIQNLIKRVENLEKGVMNE